MPILLPDTPPASMSVRPVTAKNVLTPAFGGAEQELLRKGSRYEITFDMGEMDYLETLDWSDLLVEGDTVVMTVHQPGLEVSLASDPKVNGAGQGGAFLALEQLPPQHLIRKGQFLSHLAATGQRFLYRCRAPVQANASGLATVPLYTLLRRPPADGDTVELIKPKIEGFPREVSDLTVYDNHNVEVSFKVRERE